MKNSPILLALFACFALSVSVYGQAGLERQVLGSAGNTRFTASGASLDFTVGEAAVAQTNTGVAVLSQGFHQVTVKQFTLGASTVETSLAAKIQVFPNPAQDFLQINTDTPILSTLYDLHGRPVLQQTKLETSAQLNISTLPTGTYLLRSITQDGIPAQNFKIQIIR